MTVRFSAGMDKYKSNVIGGKPVIWASFPHRALVFPSHLADPILTVCINGKSLIIGIPPCYSYRWSEPLAAVPFSGIVRSGGAERIQSSLPVHC